MNPLAALAESVPSQEPEAPALSKGASLAEQTYDFIKENIVSLRYPPGSPLLENQLAKQLGISRSPMREALARLEREGFVEIVPWKGARVTEITPKYVTELYQVRASLEGTAARLAISRLDRGRLMAMKRTMDELATSVDAGDMTAFYQHEVPFHDLYVAGCGNDLLLRTLVGMRDHLTRVRNYLSATRIPGHEAASFREHQVALEAFLSGDGDAAEAAVRNHLDNVVARMLAASGA